MKKNSVTLSIGHLRRLAIWAVCVFTATLVLAGDLHSVRLPLTFEQNKGQADPHASFLARSSQGIVFLTHDGLVLTSGKLGAARSVRLRLLNAAEDPQMDGTPTGGFANYYKSSNRSEWLEHIPLFSTVRYHDVYPGIDVLFHGHDGQLEYDFNIAPGKPAGVIRFAVEGADNISLRDNGGLSIVAGKETWLLLPPQAYQEQKSGRKSIRARYRLPQPNIVAFNLGYFDRSVPLIIDPVVQYSNLLSVGNDTNVAAIQIDGSGDLFIAGDTFALDYPVVNGLSPNPGGSDQVYLTKLNPAGNTILYSTYLPATGFSTTRALVLDANGNAYIAGTAGGPEFPFTSNLTTCSSACDGGFVAKLSPSGSLAYATLVGLGDVLPRALAVDSSGSAYTAGNAGGTSLQTVNAFEPSYVGQICTSCSNGFYAKLNSTGTAFDFASYFAGSNQFSGEILVRGIALDGSGNVLLAGNFVNGGTVPLLNPWQSVVGTLFLSKFAPDGKTLLFSTLFGSSAFQNDNLVGMAAGTDGTVYLVGNTQSGDYPYTLSAAAHPIVPNAVTIFATAIKPTLDGLVYSTYLGDGFPNAVALDANNHLHVVGTSVLNLIPLQNAVVGDVTSGSFVLELDQAGVPASVSQYGGHFTAEVPTGVAADAAGNVYVAGGFSPQNVSSPDQPDPVLVGTTFGTGTGGNFGSFFAKINPQDAPQISLNTLPPFLLLRNAGSADLHITGIALSGGLAQQLGNCGTTVPAGSSCVLTVTDANGGIAAGTVSITSDAQPSVQNFTINLSPFQKAGTPVPDQVYFQDVRFAYPPQFTGTSTGPVPMKIWNVGTGVSTINSITATGSAAQTNDCPGTLAAGASCTVQLSITVGGAQPALHVVYDTNQRQDFFSIFATATTTPTVLSSDGIEFGTQLVNGVAIPRVVNVTNTSNGTISVPGISIVGASEFILAGNTCVSPLAPHQSCQVGIQFNPVIDGLRTANLNIGSNQVSLTGTGQIASQVQVSPLELDFAVSIIGKTSTQPLKLTNTTANAISITGISFSLPDYSETDDCAGQVPANNFCTLQIAFDPQQAGARNASVSISFGSGVLGQAVTLTGTGVTPLDPMPLTLDFGTTTPVGNTSASQNVSIGNGRQATAQPYTLTITGDFSIGANSCPNPMPGFIGCVLPISFAPKTAGPQQGTLTISYPGITVQSVITLKGSGLGPGISLPGTLNFGNQLVGTNTTQALLLQSSGTAPLNIASMSITGDFTQTNDCGSSVSAGSSCTITVKFAPGATGARTGTLTVNDNAPGNPHTATLSGNGTDFQLGSSGTLTATITAGQTATYNLGLTGAGGFTGLVTLSCSGAPLAGTCSVSPGSVTVNSSSTFPFTVTVTTTARTTASGLVFFGPVPTNMIFLVLLALLSGLAPRLLRNRRLRSQFVLGAVGLALLVGIVSCGGGGGGPSPNPVQGTPAGTSTLTVTATTSGGTHQLQLTLNVQ